jgi:SDR family mycofactocin-dependent oxidoreductase
MHTPKDRRLAENDPESALGTGETVGETPRELAGVAVVTGAARGIGAAVARRLCADGWGVVLTDSCVDEPLLAYPMATEDELFATAESCGPNAVAFVADTKDQSALNAAVGIAVARFGALTAAVACAGAIAGGAPLWRTKDEVWSLMMAVNLTGPFRLAKAAVPALLDAPRPRRGRFVAVSSASATTGNSHIAAYSAAKSGLVGLVRSMAAELAEDGVTANVVCPGSTDTEMLAASAAIYGLRNAQQFSAQQPIHRLISPEEVADAVAWLCAPGAGAVTGTALSVDGGMTLG